jgi:hypothetical protein
MAYLGKVSDGFVPPSAATQGDCAAPARPNLAVDFLFICSIIKQVHYHPDAVAEERAKEQGALNQACPKQ